MEDEAEYGGITVRNNQDRRVLAKGLLEALARCGDEALNLTIERGLMLEDSPGSVEVALVDDQEIARVHGEFMDDPTPTDVITFNYGETGEIVISAETAERQSAEFQTGTEREIALYLIHGILHLCGYEDSQDSDRQKMERLQETLLAEVFSWPGSPQTLGNPPD